MNKREQYFSMVAKMEQLREEKERLTDLWNNEIAWSDSEETIEAHLQKEREINSEIQSLKTTMKLKRAGFTQDELRSMAQEWRAKGKEDRRRYLS